MNLKKLYKIIQERKKCPAEESYVASLYKQGLDRIAQKVGEEAVETVIAAKNKDKKLIIGETADLWFHILVLLSFLDIKPKEIFDELELRHLKKTKK